MDGTVGEHSETESEDFKSGSQGQSPSESDSSSERSDRTEETSWSIEAILVGGGSTGKGPHPKKLYEGHIYASAKMGWGHENYHLIAPESTRLTYRGEVGFKFPTRVLDRNKTRYPRACVVTARALDDDVEREWEQALVEEILHFCRQHRGVAVLLGGPGARQENDALRRWHCHSDQKMIAWSNKIPCLTAALVNAVSCLKGKDTARKVKGKLHEMKQHFLRVGQLSPVLHKMDEKWTIVGLGKIEKKIMRENGFEWVAKQGHGVWIVRLCEPNVTDQGVAVDCNRGLILDSEEVFPVTLRKETLRMCASPKTNSVHVAEGYQLVEA